MGIQHKIKEGKKEKNPCFVPWIPPSGAQRCTVREGEKNVTGVFFFVYPRLFQYQVHFLFTDLFGQILYVRTAQHSVKVHFL